jgi:hypothetical protein
VDRHVGAQVPALIARAQVGDRHQAADHKAGERDDRERHVQVEDLLQEAFFGFDRCIEEDEAERDAESRDCGDGEGAE